ncbi:unnamed protein product [Meganyctiphanes norvegica]|uniref:Uncharacterized protein n=1 Tax=Meganyctiphanes norvegica TaxID=48144 RepID=A0AAV2SVZ2_MEGNR
MYDNCSYHILDSLVPPSADEDNTFQNSLLRLEHICACAIVKDFSSENTNQILSKTPAPLHKIIWKAFLTDRYYKIEDDEELNFEDIEEIDEIKDLLYHWPREEFVLKELMPKLPSRLNDFHSVWDDDTFTYGLFGFCSEPIRNTKVLEFYELVVTTIVRSLWYVFIPFLYDARNKQLKQKHTCKIRKINISGFHTNLSEDLKDNLGTINDALLINSNGKLEVTLDVQLDDDDDDYGIEESLNELEHCYSQYTDSINFKIAHVSLFGQISEAKRLIHKLVNNGTVSIDLSGVIDSDVSDSEGWETDSEDSEGWETDSEDSEGWKTVSEDSDGCKTDSEDSDTINEDSDAICKDEDLNKKEKISENRTVQENILLVRLGKCASENSDAINEDSGVMDENEDSDKIEKIFENSTVQENILSVRLGRRACSLNILQNLKSLIHLDLSHNSLSGRLHTLVHMHRGLLFLNLYKCNINDMDLAPLVGSCHQATLQELNLSDNSFRFDKNSNNLISLCQNLKNVQCLNLGSCDLDSWHINEIKLLFHLFKILPNIVKLNLSGNNFSIETLKIHILVLHESPSLRYLKLSLPKTFPVPIHKKDLIKSFCYEINTKINERRSHLLYVEFSQLMYIPGLGYIDGV